MTARAISALASAVVAAALSNAAAAQTPALKLDVPFGPTSATTVDTMLRVAGVTARDFVIDLGSGDGRININAARDLGARGIGFELDPALVRTSREFARIAGVADRVEFREQNLFGADLSRATVVTLYLGPEVTPKVAPKLLTELAAGTRLVSHNWRLGDWPPDLVVNGRQHGSTVYFWWVPAHVAGVWRGTLPGTPARTITLDLRQTYQEVDGEAAIPAVAGQPDVRVTVRDARLEGERIAFLLQEQWLGGANANKDNPSGEFRFRRFSGKVSGDRMQGHFRTENPPGETPFEMTRSVRAEPGPAGAWRYRAPGVGR